MPELPMFRQNKDRVTNRTLLDDVITGWLSKRTAQEALEEFQKADVPAIKIQSIADLMNHPQVISRGNFVDVPDHDRGDVCLMSPVPRLARMPATIRWAGQDLGESTQEILQGELKLSDETFAELRKRKIVGG
jgi:succinyl-CoA---D-citramalate CoA-transferase